jgi:hypothetical protein
MISTSSDVLRVMGAWMRRADAGLARSAARNAARGVREGQLRRIEGLRALHDLKARHVRDVRTGADLTAGL